MDVEIYPVKFIGQGQLSVMPCPKATQLERDLNQLRDLGVTKIVSLLEAAEAKRVGVEREAALCAGLGINFQQFPIQDHKTPIDTLQFRQLIDDLERELRTSNSHIAVHCLAGIGRTGLVAGSLLISDGLAAAGAMDLLSDIRGCVVPQTHAQSNYLIDYEVGAEVKFIPKPRSGNWFMRWLTPA